MDKIAKLRKLGELLKNKTLPPLEKLTGLLDLVREDTITPVELKQFLELVLQVIKKSKDSFDTLSAENIQVIKDSIALIEGNYAKWVIILTAEKKSMAEVLEGKITELKGLIAKVQTIKPINGIDGKNPSPEDVVPLVLEKLPKVKIFTLEDKGEQIVEEINLLPTTEDIFKIDAKHIKNLPEFKGGRWGGGLSRGTADSLYAPLNFQGMVYPGAGIAKSTGSAWDTSISLSYFQIALGFTAENVANKSTNITTDGASDTKYPSVKSVKTYADGLVAGLLDYRGVYNASGNTYPTTGGSGTSGAITKGDMWIISVAGTLGGIAIQIGDSIIANIDTPGQTSTNWNTLNTNISYVPEDSANKVTSISGASTNTQYPSAKLLYDQLAGKQASGTYSTDIHSNITALNAVSGSNTGDQTPTSLGLVIGTNVLAQRTFGTAANNNTGDFLGASATAADSDKLDGKHDNQYIYGGVNTGSNAAPVIYNAYDISQYKSGFWDINGASWMPTTDWYAGITAAHTGNSSSYNYNIQLIGAFTGVEGYYLRSTGAGTPSAWRTIIHSGNIASQSVTYASTAPWSGISSKPTTLSGYGITDWHYGNYGSLDNVPGESGCYYFYDNSPIPGQVDGTVWYHAYPAAPTTWGSQLVQDYRTGRIYARGRNSDAWSGWLTVIDSGNIASQTVATAGNAVTLNNFTVRVDRSDGNDYSLAGRGTGIYAISGVGTNGPGTSYLNLIHSTNSTDVAFQIAGGYNSDNMYFRGTANLAGGTGYTAWRTVLHDGSTIFNGLALGKGAGTGNSNVALGGGALRINTSGYQNMSIGASTLYNNTTGMGNSAIGANALYQNISGGNNIAVGGYALWGVLGYGNIGFGYGSGSNETGSNNFYVGNVFQSTLANDRNYSLLWGTFSGSAGSLTNQQLTVNGALKVNATQTITNGNYSGQVIISQPFQGSSYKKVIIKIFNYRSSVINMFNYTYPTAFTYVPYITFQGISDGSSNAYGNPSSTGVTFQLPNTGASWNGIVIIEGF